MPTQSRPPSHSSPYRPLILLSALALSVVAVRASAEAPTPVAAAPAAPATPATPPTAAEGSSAATPHLLRIDADFGNDPFKGLNPELARKLSADDIRAIMIEKERNGQPSLGDDRVPLAFFVFLGAVICAGMYSSFRKDRQRHETLRLMVEKGTQIPPELIQPPAKPRNDLRRGLLLIGTGIGLALVLRLNPGDEHNWSVGLLPILIGAGYLVAWKLEPKPRALNLS